MVAEFSGLLDQTIANINTLFKAVKMTKKPVILFASDCLAFLLQPVSIKSGKFYALVILAFFLMYCLYISITPSWINFYPY